MMLELTKSRSTLAARLTRARPVMERCLTVPSGRMLPFLPGICSLILARVPLANLPLAVLSTTALNGPAPSVVTMWKVPEMEPPFALTWGRVDPERAIAWAIMASLFLP